MQGSHAKQGPQPADTHEKLVVVGASASMLIGRALGDEAGAILGASSLSCRVARRSANMWRLRFIVLCVLLGWLLGTLANFLGLSSVAIEVMGTHRPLDFLIAIATSSISLVLIAVAPVLFLVAQMVLGVDGLGYGTRWLFTVDSAPLGRSMSSRLATPTETLSVHGIYGWTEAIVETLEHIDEQVGFDLHGLASVVERLRMPPPPKKRQSPFDVPSGWSPEESGIDQRR